MLPRALAKVAASAALVADVAGAIDSLPASVDELALQRIRRARRDATARLERDRDTVTWKAAMARLDAEEAEVQVSPAPRLTHQAVAEALADLQLLYQRSQIGTQKRIAQALFEHVEVLGPARVWLHPSDEAVALGGPPRCTASSPHHCVRVVGARGVAPA